MDRPDDIKTRLSFSSIKSPVFKRSLLNHKEPLACNSQQQQQHYWSRMNDFHMSRQNPGVLDHMHASHSTPTSKPSNNQQPRNFHRELIYTSQKPRPHHTTILGPFNNVPADPCSPQTSLLRQMLNARRAQSSSPSNSVVQFATRNGPAGRACAGLLKRGVASPMVVRLDSARRESGEVSGGWEKRWDGEDAMKFGRGEDAVKMGRGEEDGRDPCDMKVVLNALRQKRKRWATSTPEKESTATRDPPLSPPTAKRYKPNAVDLPYPGRLSSDIGRSQESMRHPLANALPPAIKSRAVTRERPRHVIRFRTTDEIGEADSEIGEEDNEIGEEDNEIGEADSEIGEADSEIGEADSEIGEAEEDDECCEEKERRAPPAQETYGAGRRKKSSFKGDSLPLSFLVEEAKLKEKREESLRVLKTVFNSKDGEKKESLRRKHPVFCGTGSRPQLPTPTSSHLITQDDLRKEREATAAKLKEFFEGDDDKDNSAPSATYMSESCSSGNLKGLSFPTTSVGMSSSSSGGSVLASARCPSAVDSPVTKSHVTKSVSFAPLPSLLLATTSASSLLPFNTTTASSSHVPKVDSSLHTSLTSNSALQTTSVTTSTALSLSSVSSVGHNQNFTFPNGSGRVQNTSSASSEVLDIGSTQLKPIASMQSALTLPSLAMTSKPAQQNGQVLKVNPTLISSLSSQPHNSAQPSAGQLSLTTTDKLSLCPTSQVDVQPPSFNPAANSEPSLFSQAAMTGTQQSFLQASLAKPSLVQTTQGDIQVPLFQSSQMGIQHPLFQTLKASSQSSMPKPSLQTSQTGIPLSIFQNSQASTQPSLQSSLVNQASVPSTLPSVSQASQASTQPFLFQASQKSSQASSFPTSQAGAQTSIFQASQAGIQSSFFQTTSARPSLQAPPVGAQAVLLQTSQANVQPSLFQTSQAGIQSSFFQTSLAKPSLQQALQTNSQPSLFQTSLAKPLQASKGDTQSAIFQALQSNAEATPFQVSLANSQPSVFQVSQASAQPSVFQVSQASAQPSVFQASQATIQPNNNQSFANTLAQTNSLFTKKTPSNTPTFFFGQNPQKNSTGRTSSSQQQNSGGLFSHTQNSPSTFNFSATQQPQLQQSANSTGLSFGTSQVNGNSSFNFVQQSTPASLGSSLQQKSTFVFGQTSPAINFGGGMNQQQVGASVGFQTPPVGNIFNFSQGTGPVTPSSGGGRTRAKSRTGKKK